MEEVEYKNSANLLNSFHKFNPWDLKGPLSDERDKESQLVPRFSCLRHSKS